MPTIVSPSKGPLLDNQHLSHTDHRYSLVAYAAVLAWLLALPLLAMWMPVETIEGRYAYTDLASHLQMCEEFTPEIERPVCREAAYEMWDK